jgi:hypothetical protein
LARRSSPFFAVAIVGEAGKAVSTELYPGYCVFVGWSLDFCSFLLFCFISFVHF